MTVFNYSNVSDREYELFIDLNNYYPDWLNLSLEELEERKIQYSKLAASPNKSSVSIRLAYYEVTEYIKIRAKLEGKELWSPKLL